MTRFRSRLARLEGPKRDSLVIFITNRFEEDGPVVNTAWADGILHTRHDGESEKEFRCRVGQSLRSPSRLRAISKAR
jgi:hypothetical protein